MTSEGPGLIQIGFGLLINLALPLGLFFWGRSVANRRGGRGWRLASYLPLVAGLASLLGLFGTIVGLIEAFGSVSSADPSARATVLADGIATAMVSTAIGLGAAITLYATSAVTFAVGEWQSRRAPRSDAPPAP